MSQGNSTSAPITDVTLISGTANLKKKKKKKNQFNILKYFQNLAEMSIIKYTDLSYQRHEINM
jgi:hypothetical protein